MYHNPTNAGKRTASFSPSPVFNSLLPLAFIFCQEFTYRFQWDSAYKKLKRIRDLKLQIEQKENYPCYHGPFMRCFRFWSSPQPHARNSPIPRPVRLSQSPSHLVSGPGSSRSLRRSLCGRKHKKLLACPSLSEKNLNSTGLWASLVPRVKENLTVEKYDYCSWTRSDEVN